MSRSLLQTARGGAADGTPFLVLHDRYEGLADARALGAALGDNVRRIAVRAPRVQTMGGSGHTKGNYWFIGPQHHPELSTLGDGLYQLELLLGEIEAGCLGILGKGEGGVIALLAALIWPERVTRVIAIDAVLPDNLGDMPLDVRSLQGVQVVLAGDASAADFLSQRGATVLVAADVAEAVSLSAN